MLILLIIIACLCIVYQSHPIYTSGLQHRSVSWSACGLLSPSHPFQKHWSLFMVLTLGRGGGQRHTHTHTPVDFGKQGGAGGCQNRKHKRAELGPRARLLSDSPGSLCLYLPFSIFGGHFPQCTCGGKRRITCLYPWPQKKKRLNFIFRRTFGERKKQTRECMISREEKCNKCGSYLLLLFLFLIIILRERFRVYQDLHATLSLFFSPPPLPHLLLDPTSLLMRIFLESLNQVHTYPFLIPGNVS